MMQPPEVGSVWKKETRRHKPHRRRVTGMLFNYVTFYNEREWFSMVSLKQWHKWAATARRIK